MLSRSVSSVRGKSTAQGRPFFVITTDFSDGSSLTILLSLALTARKLSIFIIQTPLHLSTTRCLFAPDELHDNQLLRLLLMTHRMFAQLRKSATVTEKRRRIDEFTQRLEKLAGFARMLQTIARLSPVRFVADDLGKSQCRQNVTYPRHAPPNGACDLTRSQFLILSEHVHNGKG